MKEPTGSGLLNGSLSWIVPFHADVVRAVQHGALGLGFLKQQFVNVKRVTACKKTSGDEITQLYDNKEN